MNLDTRLGRGPITRGIGNSTLATNATKGEPPHLDEFSNQPNYDLATVAEMLGVRRMTLWAWEQQLGMSRPGFGANETMGQPRYSERDLRALLWLRDQILDGIPPHVAAAQLFTQPHPRPADAARSGPLPLRPRINTDPIHGSAFGTYGPARPGGPGRYAQPTAVLQPGDRIANAITYRPAFTSVVSPSLPQGPQPVGVLGAPDLRALVPLLAQAFAALDAEGARRVVDDALSSWSVELMCVRLLEPALARVGELAARNQVLSAEERFAEQYVRGLLHAFLHSTPERSDAPLVLLGCGPREYDDIPALVNAVFWRRAGLRVVYLGDDLDGAAIAAETRSYVPAAIAQTVTSAQRVRTLGRIAREIANLPAPRPIFVYSGPTFARNPELQHRVGGIYLGDDPVAACRMVTRLLGVDHSRPTHA